MVGVEPSTEITGVTVDRDSHVEVTFADGAVCRFDLVDLRLACPCATCRDRRDRDEAAWRPSPSTPLTVADAQFVGAWGLGITWSDGHSTGIYPFESLRRWCDAGEPGRAFPPDSGLPGPGPVPPDRR
jgi:DUF971 family protein